MLGLMSPAAIAANSTRELSKLSVEQQLQAKRLNKGKHDANAGGYGLKNRWKGGSAPRNALAKKRKPASSQSHKDRRRQLTSELDFHEDTERQPPTSASEQDHANQCQNHHGSAPNTQHASPDSVPGELYGYEHWESSLHFGLANNDFGPFEPSSGTYEYLSIGPAFLAPNTYIPPFGAWEGSSSGTQSTLNTPANGRDLSMLDPIGDIDHHCTLQTTEHAQAIQEDFMTTQAQFHPRDWPPNSTTNQSYMFQMSELCSHFQDTTYPSNAQVAPGAGSSDVPGVVETFRSRGDMALNNHAVYTGAEQAFCPSIMARDWTGGT